MTWTALWQEDICVANISIGVKGLEKLFCEDTVDFNILEISALKLVDMIRKLWLFGNLNSSFWGDYDSWLMKSSVIIACIFYFVAATEM